MSDDDKPPRINLTRGMLDAMLDALSEMLAGEGPQGCNEGSKEAAEVMRNAERAHAWIHQEKRRRGLKP
jgi:hypothetical protein